MTIKGATNSIIKTGDGDFRVYVRKKDGRTVALNEKQKLLVQQGITNNSTTKSFKENIKNLGHAERLTVKLNTFKATRENNGTTTPIGHAIQGKYIKEALKVTQYLQESPVLSTPNIPKEEQKTPLETPIPPPSPLQKQAPLVLANHTHPVLMIKDTFSTKGSNHCAIITMLQMIANSKYLCALLADNPELKQFSDACEAYKKGEIQKIDLPKLREELSRLAPQGDHELKNKHSTLDPTELLLILFDKIDGEKMPKVEVCTTTTFPTNDAIQESVENKSEPLLMIETNTGEKKSFKKLIDDVITHKASVDDRLNNKTNKKEQSYIKQRTQYITEPDFLFVGFKRNPEEGQEQIQNITCELKVPVKDKNPATLELRSFNVYTPGHHFAYVKDSKENCWYCCDNVQNTLTKLDEIAVQKILNTNVVYMLYYEKKGEELASNSTLLPLDEEKQRYKDALQFLAHKIEKSKKSMWQTSDIEVYINYARELQEYSINYPEAESECIDNAQLLLDHIDQPIAILNNDLSSLSFLSKILHKIYSCFYFSVEKKEEFFKQLEYYKSNATELYKKKELTAAQTLNEYKLLLDLKMKNNKAIIKQSTYPLQKRDETEIEKQFKRDFPLGGLYLDIDNHMTISEYPIIDNQASETYKSINVYLDKKIRNTLTTKSTNIPSKELEKKVIEHRQNIHDTLHQGALAESCKHLQEICRSNNLSEKGEAYIQKIDRMGPVQFSIDTNKWTVSYTANWRIDWKNAVNENAPPITHKLIKETATFTFDFKLDTKDISLEHEYTPLPDDTIDLSIENEKKRTEEQKNLKILCKDKKIFEAKSVVQHQYMLDQYVLPDFTYEHTNPKTPITPGAVLNDINRNFYVCVDNQFRLNPPKNENENTNESVLTTITNKLCDEHSGLAKETLYSIIQQSDTEPSLSHLAGMVKKGGNFELPMNAGRMHEDRCQIFVNGIGPHVYTIDSKEKKIFYTHYYLISYSEPSKNKPLKWRIIEETGHYEYRKEVLQKENEKALETLKSLGKESEFTPITALKKSTFTWIKGVDEMEKISPIQK